MNLDVTPLLLKIKEYHWHILPSTPVAQEVNMATYILGRRVGITGKNIPQKDGSKFKCMFSKCLNQADIVDRLSVLAPESIKPIIQTFVTKQELLNLILTNKIDPNICVYRAYWTHTFLNGRRVIPVIIDPVLDTFYDASVLFPEFIPEDDIGLLINDYEDITISTPKYDWKLGSNVIEYLSYVRLCPCCGIVSNTRHPRKNVWGGLKHINLYQKPRL